MNISEENADQLIINAKFNRYLLTFALDLDRNIYPVVGFVIDHAVWLLNLRIAGKELSANQLEDFNKEANNIYRSVLCYQYDQLSEPTSAFEWAKLYASQSEFASCNDSARYALLAARNAINFPELTPAFDGIVATCVTKSVAYNAEAGVLRLFDGDVFTNAEGWNMYDSVSASTRSMIKDCIAAGTYLS